MVSPSSAPHEKAKRIWMMTVNIASGITFLRLKRRNAAKNPMRDTKVPAAMP